MSSRKFLSALTAAALVASPTMAVAQAAPQPLAPAEETVEGSELRGNGAQILPILFIIAIVFLIREIVKDRDLGDDPRSP